MLARRALPFVAVLALVGVLIVPAVVVSAPDLGGGMPALTASITKYDSSNWAGYVASAPNGSVTRVSADWIEPTGSCTSGPSYAAFWVGLDGATDNSVEQTGTLIVCSSGVASYYAWWELYPSTPIELVKGLSLAPGDRVSASVAYSSGAFKMTISVAGHSFSKKASEPASRNSAECIAEDIAVGSTLAPLTDFGKIRFTSCKATLSGASGGIGTFATVGQFTMIDSAGHVLASTSDLNSAQKAFSVNWKRSA